MLWRLIGAKVAIYSAHTAFDSAAAGINQAWAESIGLGSIEPLLPIESESPTVSNQDKLGAGRQGKLADPVSLEELIAKVSGIVGSPSVRWVGDCDRMVSKVAFACGSGGSFLAAARRHGVDVLVTGEATFHTCLDARSSGLALILLGHYQSERFAMERLAAKLAEEFSELNVWASERETDPLRSFG
jgi:dinuclear metal center YbgI/SA1388 family protein